MCIQKYMVGRVGFEPTTNWLKANCSTTELTTRKGCESYGFLSSEQAKVLFLSKVSCYVVDSCVDKTLFSQLTAFTVPASATLKIGLITRYGERIVYL